MTWLVLWLSLCHALAATVADVQACLRAYDVPCAEAALADRSYFDRDDAGWLVAEADVHFHAGRYPEAYEAMSAAVAKGYADRYDNLGLYERTMYATAGWVAVRGGDLEVRYRPGIDAILVDDAFEVLQLTERHIGPLLGGPPPGVRRVELFPDARSFIAASSLMATDIRTTGVVGLAKWSRLLITSPRVLARGYDWKSTTAHEHIHIMVAHHTNDLAPVWLQEAIAKYLDERWRDGTDRFQLGARQEAMVAEALRKDDFVRFEEMHPSLAKLPSAQRAALAYAQLATLMQFSFERGGEQLLLRVLPRVGAGEDPMVALAEEAGFSDFQALQAGWRGWLETQDYVERAVAELPVVLEGGDELDTDPVLARREDLARFVTLGDLLREAGEAEASLVEYAKAVPVDEPPSPVLSNRMAMARRSLGQLERARALLEESLDTYPEFALTLKNLGAVRADLGDVDGAVGAYVDAVALAPFDPEIQQALVDLYERRGQADRAQRHRRALDIRARGGADSALKPIHERAGDFELPDYEPAVVQERQRARRDSVNAKWAGELAPDWSSLTLDGDPLRPEAFPGKVIVLDFWATWCGPCREAMPHLDSLHQRRDDVVVIGLTDESPAAVKPFLAKNPVAYPIGVDRGGRVKARYEVSALPTAFIIDPAGRIVKVQVGGGKAAVDAIELAVNEALQRTGE